MIDHLGLDVSDLEKSKKFYEVALAPLGYKILMDLPASVTGTVDCVGFGIAPKADFWISRAPANKVAPIHLHIAFTADTREVVDAFYKAALAAGAKDNGAPGPRPQYHERYYGAFVLDPDGHNIEAVCHR